MDTLVLTLQESYSFEAHPQRLPYTLCTCRTSTKVNLKIKTVTVP